MPSQNRLVLAPSGSAEHAHGYRARRLALGTVALKQPPWPEPLAQVLPLPVHRTRRPAPKVLLDLPAQLTGYPGPEPPAVRQREVLGVQISDPRRHLSGGHQSATSIPPAQHTDGKNRTLVLLFYYVIIGTYNNYIKCILGIRHRWRGCDTSQTCLFSMDIYNIIKDLQRFSLYYYVHCLNNKKM